MIGDHVSTSCERGSRDGSERERENQSRWLRTTKEVAQHPTPNMRTQCIHTHSVTHLTDDSHWDRQSGHPPHHTDHITSCACPRICTNENRFSAYVQICECPSRTLFLSPHPLSVFETHSTTVPLTSDMPKCNRAGTSPTADFRSFATRVPKRQSCKGTC